MIAQYTRSKKHGPAPHIKSRWRWHRVGIGSITMITLALLFFSQLHYLDSARHAFVDFTASAARLLLEPVRSARQLYNDIQVVTKFHMLLENYKMLQRQVGTLSHEVQQLRLENQALRLFTKAAPDSAKVITTARVLFAPNTLHHHTLLLNAGTRDYVHAPMAVINHQGVVGRIIEAGDHVARVLLITDTTSRIPVWVTSSHQHGIVTGQNNGRPVLTYLAQPEIVKPGDLIVTSGYEGVFPVGLPVGVVESIHDGMIQIRPFAELSKLEFVQVVQRQ